MAQTKLLLSTHLGERKEEALCIEIGYCEPIRLHFIGISGISMTDLRKSALKGFTVSLKHKGISFNEETGF